MAVESAINEAPQPLVIGRRRTTLSLVLVEQVARRDFVFASSDGSQRGHTNQKTSKVPELALRH